MVRGISYTLYLVYIITLSISIVAYAIWVIRNMKIRLNKLTRIKWIVGLIAIIMRVVLTIIEYAKESFE